MAAPGQIWSRERCLMAAPAGNLGQLWSRERCLMAAPSGVVGRLWFRERCLTAAPAGNLGQIWSREWPAGTVLTSNSAPTSQTYILTFTALRRQSTILGFYP